MKLVEKIIHHSSSSISSSSQIPKGYMVIRVGEEGEEQQRFLVPVIYFSHPLFLKLLKEAEEVYGFEHIGAITIPCRVDYFCQVRGMIDREIGGGGGGGGSGSGGGQNGHYFHLHLPLSGCFRA